jgi:hypothetical protein
MKRMSGRNMEEEEQEEEDKVAQYQEESHHEKKDKDPVSPVYRYPMPLQSEDTATH